MSAPQVSRRSVTRGAAWSVPLVAVGVAAPAFATSASQVAVTAVTVCQCAGGVIKKYALTVTFTNSTNLPVTLDSVAISEAGIPVVNQTPTTGEVAAGPPTTQLTFSFNRLSNASTGTFTVTFTTNPASPTQPYTTPIPIPTKGDCVTPCP